MSLPDIVTSVADLRARVAAWRRAGESVALVPTMGALHEGHLALVRRGREIARRVVVSIFVNPKQFAATDDFGRYPRTEARDRALLGDAADLVFAPGPADMYPEGFASAITVEGPSEGYEGAARPGHFSGVATVVAKLFLQCAPDVALFGEKDWQQLQVVRRLVADLDLPLQVVAHPTVRDEAGLALSSRNARAACGLAADPGRGPRAPRGGRPARDRLRGRGRCRDASADAGARRGPAGAAPRRREARRRPPPRQHAGRGRRAGYSALTILTRLVPDIPSAWAEALDRSITRPWLNGPRSLIRTTIERPLV